MPKVGIYAFHNMRVALIPDIADMSAGEYNVKVAKIAVRTIIFRISGAVHDSLQSERASVELDVKAYDLTGFAAYHRHNVSIFTGFCIAFFACEPV